MTAMREIKFRGYNGEKWLFEEAKGLMRERDQARKCAEEMRDLYAAEIDESIAVFPFPWEDEHGADRDGE